jgi:cyclophilin family peptidyl-prolyl cis-trans isomerase
LWYKIAMRRLTLILCLLAGLSLAGAAQNANNVSLDIRLRLLRSEDTRDWNEAARQLLKHKDAGVRVAAALTAGRIGDERACLPLVELLQNDKDEAARTMAAFALGEIESEQGADALIAVVSDGQREPPELRARALEALGKITAALPEPAKELKALYGKAILDALRFEAGRRSRPDESVILAGVTAALRARPEGAGAVVAEFIGYANPRVRADALNALARLRAKDKLPDARQLLKDPDPIVRANAARVLGGAEDKESVDALLEIATKDVDSRARVSAIRALGALKDEKSAKALLESSNKLSVNDAGELLEIAATLGRIYAGKQNAQAVARLKEWREAMSYSAPEVEAAFARIAPYEYQRETTLSITPNATDKQLSALAQGLAELATIKTGNGMTDLEIRTQSIRWLEGELSCPESLPMPSRVRVKPRRDVVYSEVCTPLPVKAAPDFLRAYAAFKPEGLTKILLEKLCYKDVIARSTAADLLGDLPPSEENTKALIDALPIALKDNLNDAAMSVLGALAKQKSDKANAAIKTALEAPDYLARWRAIDLLKRNGAGDFSERRFPVKSQFAEADYQEALALSAKDLRAVVETDKGAFTIRLRPDAAPLNVLSFVRLARRGYFNGITWHRVVPNFVVQGGDPRGDGNGGPGYSLRCEINQLPYERGAVGMALSGKDTGGSQWFVTHSPQPHLDGGYTVFGNVTQGLETVDKIARGDKIRRVRILVGR